MFFSWVSAKSNDSLAQCFCCRITYRNGPKFLDRQVLANSVRPWSDWSGSTLFAIPSTAFGPITLWKGHLVENLGWLPQTFRLSEFLGVLRYHNDFEYSDTGWQNRLKSGSTLPICLFFFRNYYMSRRATKATKWSVRPGKADQPGHLPSLIRVFAIRMKKPWILGYPLSALRILWSDWLYAQADLSLRWAHRSFCLFCHEAVHYGTTTLYRFYDNYNTFFRCPKFLDAYFCCTVKEYMY